MLRSLKLLIVDFGHKTTCHGLSQILLPDRRKLYRVMWFFLVCGLTGGVTWQLTVAIKEYTRYSTSTDIQEEYATEIRFPAVTICNLNRFFGIQSMLELKTVDAFVRASSPYRDRKFDDWWIGETNKFYETNGNAAFYLSDEFKAKGWQLNNKTLTHCLFQQKRCSIKNFTRVITPMGMCYSFTTNETLVQNVPGSGHGLVVHLDIDQFRYNEHPEYGNSDAGVKIHIHNHDEPSEVESFGLAVPSGHGAHVVIRKTMRDLMYKPWGICSLEDKPLSYHDHYSTAACMRECRFNYIVDRCGCRPHWATEVFDVQECEGWDILNCSGEAEAQFSSQFSMHSCFCNEPCKFVAYDPKVFYTTFPSIVAGEIFYKMLKNDSLDETQEVLSKDIEEIDPGFVHLKEYRENHLMLNIYYDSLSFMHMQQSKRVTEISLMSNVGGLLGLWLGISLVTVSEFVQLFFQFLKEWWRLRTVIAPAIEKAKVFVLATKMSALKRQEEEKARARMKKEEAECRITSIEEKTWCKAANIPVFETVSETVNE